MLGDFRNYHGVKLLIPEILELVEISEYSQKNTCAGASSLQQVVPWEYFEIFKDTFFEEHLRHGYFLIYFWGESDYNISHKYCNWEQFNPIQDGPFQGCSRIGGKKAPLPKICQAYPTIMKLGTVIPYLKKIQKYMNHLTHLLSSADSSIFSSEISQFSCIKKQRYRFHFYT